MRVFYLCGILSYCDAYCTWSLSNKLEVKMFSGLFQNWLHRAKIVFWAGLLLVLCAMFAFCLERIFKPFDVADLSQEIYQVRQQLVVSQTSVSKDGLAKKNKTIIVLRNAKGHDFQLEIPEALPGDSYFAKPYEGEDGTWVLVPVLSIVEEQKGE